MNKEPVLSLNHINSGYYNGGLFRRKEFQQVLHDVSFDVYHGEILGLVGAPGNMSSRAFGG